MDRQTVLDAYQLELRNRKEKGFYNLEDVETLKIFCGVNNITLAEHRQSTAVIELNPQDLTDESNLSLEDWLSLRSLQQSGERTLPAPGAAPEWHLKLSAPPLKWQTQIAVLAAVILVIGILGALFM
jgi:hypothetical protein